MKRYYEIVTIFVPDIAEEKLNEKIKRVKNLINSSNGEVIKEENWGNKKLAYEIKKFNNGIYYFIFSTSLTIVERITNVTNNNLFFMTMFLTQIPNMFLLTIYLLFIKKFYRN